VTVINIKWMSGDALARAWAEAHAESHYRVESNHYNTELSGAGTMTTTITEGRGYTTMPLWDQATTMVSGTGQSSMDSETLASSSIKDKLQSDIYDEIEDSNIKP
jgi:hypothetical protein